MGEEERRHLIGDGRRHGADLLDHRQHAEIALAGDLGFKADEAVHQHQAPQASRRHARQLHAPHATDGEPHQHALVDAEGIEQRQVIPGQGRQGAGPLGQHIGIPVTPKLGHDAAIMLLRASICGAHMALSHR